MEPMETKALKPTFSRKLQSSTAVHSAPLWLMKATLPGRATLRAKVAFSPRIGIHHAQAVGADEPHLAADDLRDLPLQLLAMLAKLLEAGRNDNRRRNADLHRLGNDVRHVSAGVVTTTRSTLSGRSLTLG
jgi:hypothetical protein